MSDGAHDRRLHSAYDGLYGQAVDKQVLALLRYGAGASVPKTTHPRQSSLGSYVNVLCMPLTSHFFKVRRSWRGN